MHAHTETHIRTHAHLIRAATIDPSASRKVITYSMMSYTQTANVTGFEKAQLPRTILII